MVEHGSHFKFLPFGNYVFIKRILTRKKRFSNNLEKFSKNGCCEDACKIEMNSIRFHAQRILMFAKESAIYQNCF